MIFESFSVLQLLSIWVVLVFWSVFLGLYRTIVDRIRSGLIASPKTNNQTIKLFEEAGIIEKLDIGDGRARYEEAGEHHEHLIDVETGEIIEFQNEELEEMKRQVALNMGYELVDHRLELFGKKIKK